MRPLNTGDCLIEVTTWADLTVYITFKNFKLKYLLSIKLIQVCDNTNNINI